MYTFLPQLQPPSPEGALRIARDAGVAAEDAGAVKMEWAARRAPPG